jgi:hypothetical protein
MVKYPTNENGKLIVKKRKQSNPGKLERALYVIAGGIPGAILDEAVGPDPSYKNVNKCVCGNKLSNVDKFCSQCGKKR